MVEEKKRLNEILDMLENPIRRKIVQKLSLSPNYPLQLAKELGISQQAVMKHLKCLENFSLVDSFIAPSDAGGPPRRLYSLKDRYTLLLDIGPNIYDAKLLKYGGKLEELKLPEDIKKELLKMENRINNTEKLDMGEREKTLSKFMGKVEAEIKEVEEYRKGLMTLKDKISKSLKLTFQDKISLRDWQERDLLYYVLWEGIRDLRSLSSVLNIGEDSLKMLIDQLTDDLLLSDFLDDI